MKAIGSHEVIQLILKELKKEIEISKTVLVIGSGNGAMEHHLLKINSNLKITSSDIENSLSVNIKKKINSFIKLDLNSITLSLFKKRKYDLIICTEVIEHINNPWTLIEMGKHVLSSKGKFVISTPNPLNIYSRFHYLTNGRFLYFYKEDMAPRYEHTNPIFYWEMLKILHYSNMELTKMYGAKYSAFSFSSIFKSLMNIVPFLYSYLVRFRNIFFQFEESKTKDFETLLYSQQIIYIISKK
jgi:2-polyprenyl-3-methyl-5-hydroxy-6-metoxy-1,4-benzoquinol methylase